MIDSSVFCIYMLKENNKIMAKICFPHHTCGEFRSLNEAYHYLVNSQYGWYRHTLKEILMCNVMYRDHLREYGVDALIDRITGEVPELSDEVEALDYLRGWADKEKLASYDIQCFNIKDTVTINGHEFNGLEDVIKHVELVGKEFFSGFECHAIDGADVCSDVRVGELYQNYPIFDSYDIGDDRTYQNYIFRRGVITVQDMESANSIYHKGNFCMVHERIPSVMLPILYYSGEGDYMLLATDKS